MRRWPGFGIALVVLVHCGGGETGAAPAADAGADATSAGDGDTIVDARAPEAGSDTDSSADADSAADADSGKVVCDKTAPPPRVKVELVASDLFAPWSMAFLPNGDMLLTEREGRIRLLRRGGTLEPTPVPGGPATEYANQGGYWGLAIDPRFATRPYVYLAFVHVYPGVPRTAGLRVSRFRWDRETLVDELPILDGPHEDDTVTNAGGRIAFGADGKLYVTIGERALGLPAQELDNLHGKIVRIGDDGTIPADNPFVNTPGARKEIWTFGHRNPQGIMLRPETGAMYATEHGSADHDEINLLPGGGNYGYPGYAVDASAPNLVAPLLDFTPAVAPSGATFYQSNVLAGWCGDLFVACLVGERILRIRFGPSAGTPPVVESLFQGTYGRIRDVAQGPDGYLYFVEDAFTGANIRRIVPE